MFSSPDDLYDPYGRRPPAWKRRLAAWKARACALWAELGHDPARLALDPAVALRQRRRYLNRGAAALVIAVALAVGLLLTRPEEVPPPAREAASEPSPMRGLRGSVTEHRVAPPVLEVQGDMEIAPAPAPAPIRR